MTASHLEFYGQFNISPVRQDISDLERHFQRREALYLGLRRIDGVDLAAYAARYGAGPDRYLGPELAELTARELIETRAGILRLTARGRLFADEVFLRLRYTF